MPQLCLLTLPPEIREIVYGILFQPTQTIQITPAAHLPDPEPESTTWPVDNESWAIEPYKASAQILRTCKQLHSEGISWLYSYRTFDLTIREAPLLALHNIRSRSFCRIRRLLITWDDLEELARLTNKRDYSTSLSGVECIELLNWRVRHFGGSTTNWRPVVGAERALLQAVTDVLRKLEKLKFVAETTQQRKGSASTGPMTPGANQGKSNIRKVKWRLLAHLEDMVDGEEYLDLSRELAEIKAKAKTAEAGGYALPMIDPL